MIEKLTVEVLDENKNIKFVPNNEALMWKINEIAEVVNEQQDFIKLLVFALKEGKIIDLTSHRK